MENQKPLREIKVPRGLNLKKFQLPESLAKHKKKIALALSIASIGGIGAFVALDVMSPAGPRVNIPEFNPAQVVSVAPQEDPAAPVTPPGTDQQQPPPVPGQEPVPAMPPQPNLPGNAQLQGSGVVQPMATAPADQLNGTAKPAAGMTIKPVEPSLADQVASLNERLAAQDAKIAQLQDETTRLKAQLETRPKEVKKAPSLASGNSFDIRRLNLISITAENAVVKTANGGTVVVTPGKAFPGGVVFISYDPTSHVMKTTAGDFLVQS